MLNSFFSPPSSPGKSSQSCRGQTNKIEEVWLAFQEAAGLCYGRKAGRPPWRPGRVLKFVYWDLDKGCVGQGQWKPRDLRAGGLGLRAQGGDPRKEEDAWPDGCIDSSGESPPSQALSVLAWVAALNPIRAALAGRDIRNPVSASNSSWSGLFHTGKRPNPPSDLTPRHLTGGQLLLLQNGPQP